MNLVKNVPVPPPYKDAEKHYSHKYEGCTALIGASQPNHPYYYFLLHAGEDANPDVFNETDVVGIMMEGDKNSDNTPFPYEILEKAIAAKATIKTANALNRAKIEYYYSDRLLAGYLKEKGYYEHEKDGFLYSGMWYPYKQE